MAARRQKEALTVVILAASAGAVLGAVLSAPVVNQALKRWLPSFRKRRALVLRRPLVTFDLEATGLNVSRDRIVEIAAIKLMPDGQRICKGPQRLNPTVTMTADVIDVHGISNDDVAGAPKFADVAKEWLEFLAGCDLHGYNAAKFDVPLLRAEFLRANIRWPPPDTAVLDSYTIFIRNEPRNLGAALQFYCGQALVGAHSAMNDSQATLQVLMAQVGRYSELPCEVEQLAAYCSRPMNPNHVTADGKFVWRGDDAIFSFGRHQGETVRAVLYEDRDYLLWMTAQGNFSDETVALVQRALNGELPQRVPIQAAVIADGVEA